MFLYAFQWLYKDILMDLLNGNLIFFNILNVGFYIYLKPWNKNCFHIFSSLFYCIITSNYKNLLSPRQHKYYKSCFICQKYFIIQSFPERAPERTYEISNLEGASPCRGQGGHEWREMGNKCNNGPWVHYRIVFLFFPF